MRLDKYIMNILEAEFYKTVTPAAGGGRQVTYNTATQAGQAAATGYGADDPLSKHITTQRAQELKISNAGPNAFYKTVTPNAGGGRTVAYNTNTPAGQAAGQAAAVPSPAAAAASPAAMGGVNKAGQQASMFGRLGGVVAGSPIASAIMGAGGSAALGTAGAVAAPIALAALGGMAARAVARRVNPNARQAILAKKMQKAVSSGKEDKAKKIEGKLKKSIAKHGDRLTAQQAVAQQGQVQPAPLPPTQQNIGTQQVTPQPQ